MFTVRVPYTRIWCGKADTVKSPSGEPTPVSIVTVHIPSGEQVTFQPNSSQIDTALASIHTHAFVEVT